ncbi:hypothetical protein [Kocuria rosea]|uniref:hypothetical protein n=1 Tax=Kocuria rosea TaxID=1275 RepID=UPI000E00660B|nr:hypothetical protein [Kocuria rosea]STX07150.1 Uncharacterised protein [Kocuria rosea]
MKMAPIRWDRGQALADIHKELHGYLSAAGTQTDLPLMLEHLLGFDHGYRRRLLALALLVNPATADAVKACERFLKQAVPQVSHKRQELQGVVRGPVLWEQTIQRRIATADPTVFVCRPAERRFDTPALRLVRLFLTRLILLEKNLPHINTPQAAIDCIDHAHQVLQSAKMTTTRRVRQLSPEMIAAVVNRHPQIEPVVDILPAIEDALQGGSSQVLLDTFFGGVLSPIPDSDVFELWVGFQLLALFRAHGAHVSAFPVERGTQKVPFARIQLRGRTVVMWFQVSYWSVIDSEQRGSYATALKIAGIKQSSLRPDFILQHLDDGSLRLVEVKLTISDGAAANSGLRDCLAYLHDLKSSDISVRALVVASNTTGEPALHEVAIAGPDSLTDEMVFRQLIESEHVLVKRGQEAVGKSEF